MTKTMVPREELLSKPIKLRNALIFYLGHIPTFLGMFNGRTCFFPVPRLNSRGTDIHLTRALRGKPTDPKYYKQIFERGIDPDVENPEQCHAHSEIPDEWPPLDEILDYSERVRNRARSILEEGSALQNRCLGEALWIGFEHEAMHLETFLYMLLQSEKTLPPIGVETPDFAKLALTAKENETDNKWFRIPQQSITIGLDDSDDNVLPKDSFGWDNEKPQRSVHVNSFEAQARPITNGEYAKYMQANRLEEIPASWTRIHSDQGNPISKGFGESRQSAARDFMDSFAVRTVFGPVSLDLAQDWPIIASYDELARYAKWTGCRIPTHEEVRSIYLYADQLRGTGVHKITNGHRYIPSNFDISHMSKADAPYSNGMNGTSHQVNGTPNGVTHMTNGTAKNSSTAETPVFRALDGCNVGFQNWHPVPITPNGDKLAGQGDLGGVWEWTSTPLMAHESFKAMEIYPGYTCK